MNALALPITGALRIAGRKVSQWAIKHSPAILTTVGIGAGVAATYFACKATKEMVEENPIEQDLLTLEDTHAWREEQLADPETAATFDNKEYMKLAFPCYKSIGGKLLKLYWKPLVLGGISITSILGANKILSVREISALAAATTFSDMLRDYRTNVIEELGEEADKRFKFGIKEVTTEEVVLDKDGNPKIDKNGEVKTKTVKNQVVTHSMNPNSVYARVYADGFVDKSCWFDNEEYNKVFLYGKLEYWNKELKRRAIGHEPGVVLLNEVYEDLGYGRTEAGATVGWTYWNHAEDMPESYRCDGYISFGLDDIFDENGHINEQKAGFMNNEDMAVILDFNVDGPVSKFYRTY